MPELSETLQDLKQLFVRKSFWKIAERLPNESGIGAFKN